MNIAKIVLSVFIFLLLAPLAPQGQDVELTTAGKIPGKPFEVLQLQIDALLQEVAEFKAQLAAFSLKENGDLVISGINVYVQDGSGTTHCVIDGNPCNGKGNLIVGYDESDGDDLKTGSHNLVVGKEHTYTSHGGLVAGRNNAITRWYATVTGGRNNIASGGHSSVSGGNGNSATGGNASVSGGHDNIASGWTASVSGGAFNTASSFQDSVSGGWENTASGGSSSVSGGIFNVASGGSSSVSGGNANMAAGGNSTVGGGLNRSTNPDNYDEWVAGSLYEPY